MSAASTRSGGQQQPDLAELRADLARDLPDLLAGHTLLSVTVGLGKTSAIVSEVVKQVDKPWLSIVPTLAQQGSFVADAKGRGETDAGGHIARRNPTATERETGIYGLGVCHQLSAVAEVGGKRQVPAAQLCAGGPCLHGLRDAWREASGQDPAKQAEIWARGERHQRAHPDAPSFLDVLPCEYLPGVRRETAMRVLVATAAAFSQSMLTQRDQATKESAGRSVVIDELPAMAEAGWIRPANISRWYRGLIAATHVLSVQRDRATARDDDHAADKLTAVGQYLQIALDSIEQIERLMRANALTTESLIPLAAKLGAAAKKAVGKADAAAWEDIEIEWDADGRAQVDAALKAAKDLAWACEHGAVEIVPGQVVREATGQEHWREPAIWFAAPTQLGRWLLKTLLDKDQHVLVADASPPLWLRDVWRVQDGTVRELHPELPVAVERDSRIKWARGPRKTGSERAAKTKQRAEEQLRLALSWARLGSQPAIILTSKAECEYLVEEKLYPADLLGYWDGPQVRAHNRWANSRHLAIFGRPARPPEELRRLYSTDRALALAGGASPEDWPEWDGTAAPDRVREWDNDWAGAQIYQAIGRLRPLSNAGAQVKLFGPQIDLSRWGVTVHELGEDITHPPTQPPQSPVNDKATLKQIDRLLGWAEGAGEAEKQGHIHVTRTAAREAGAAGRNDTWTEALALRAAMGSWREVEAWLRAKKAELEAATGLAVEKRVIQVRGHRRVLRRVVVSEQWLRAQGGSEHQPARMPTRQDPIRLGPTGTEVRVTAQRAGP